MCACAAVLLHLLVVSYVRAFCVQCNAKHQHNPIDRQWANPFINILLFIQWIAWNIVHILFCIRLQSDNGEGRGEMRWRRQRRRWICTPINIFKRTRRWINTVFKLETDWDLYFSFVGGLTICQMHENNAHSNGEMKHAKAIANRCSTISFTHHYKSDWITWVPADCS